MKKMTLPLLVLLAACAKPKSEEKVTVQTETKETIMKVVRGSGEKCPEVTGYYVCTGSGEMDGGGMDLLLSKNRKGQIVMTQEVERRAGAKPDLLEGLIEQYITGHRGHGAVTNGDVFEYSMFSVSLKYSVNCSRKSLSLHTVLGNAGYRMTLHQLPNGDLKAVTASLDDEKSDLRITTGTCVKSVKPGTTPAPKAEAPKVEAPTPAKTPEATKSESWLSKFWSLFF